MKIAILSSGLEHRKDRGYENASRNLFNNLISETKENLEVTLFKGSGISAANEVVLDGLIDLSLLHRLGYKLINDFYGLEYAQFALQFLVFINRHNLKYNTVYTQEPRVAKTLYQLRKLLPGNPVLVYGMGINLTPEHYIRMSDKVHLVNIEHFKEANKAYPYVNKFSLIPNTLPENKKYYGSCTKDELREKYGIKTPFVLLSVGAINAGVKRMDYVVREAAKLDSTWTLVLCGKVQDDDIIALGKRMLGERFINFMLSPDDIAEAYAIADLFVLSSLIEGFGNVTIEAMQNSLPVLLHKRELNRWIVEDPDLLVDMTKEGALSDRIREKTSNEWLITKGRELYLLFQMKYQWRAVREMYFDLLEIK
ncbi:glycosyltransferase family 4 protein [Pontibacter burrus]|uniref:Glycosyltransferase family 4 protein n=1 Tax=Pontibacter burrus TaxID=2704466 RepID=A0A6B3LZQ0_9BACT|nr:glycosyltransferase family 4 protein [Pontibacter burrus]NEM98887.1 glycosyltransferase family 4 protein [Pontibacter burrus]